MAATPHYEATNAAVKILESGGNAVDAAVAAAFALAVVEPYHSGIGGGEFAVVWMTSGETIALDARESAPAGSTPNMYVDPSTGDPYSDKSYRGGLAVGVPGSVAGRAALIERFGNLTLSKVIQPSVDLANDGFIVDRYLANRIKGHQDRLAESGAGKVFFKDDQPIQRGGTLVQPSLASTLLSIGKDNGKSFYHGKMARAIANACQENDGIITTKDLESYKIFWREPVRFNYRGLTILSMPPPSSGGACLAEILNILEGFPMSYLEQGSAESYHLIASAFEYAFADRAHWLGDPEFTPQPTGGMASTEYADELRKNINRHHRTPVKDHGEPWDYGTGKNTSHISVIDKDGNMCSLTTSVNTSFGSHVFVSELGFFLNSTMDDFATTPSEPNKYDLVGGDVNNVAPNKRPLSSMSPTLILKDNQPYISLGSVGGPRIISSIAQMIVNIADYEMDVQAAMDAPRIHMQWKPDKLYIEQEIAPEVVTGLRLHGWTVKIDGRWSLSQAVMFNKETGEFFGASDARGVGTAKPREF